MEVVKIWKECGLYSFSLCTLHSSCTRPAVTGICLVSEPTLYLQNMFSTSFCNCSKVTFITSFLLNILLRRFFFHLKPPVLCLLLLFEVGDYIFPHMYCRWTTWDLVSLVHLNCSNVKYLITTLFLVEKYISKLETKIIK